MVIVVYGISLSTFSAISWLLDSPGQPGKIYQTNR